MVARPFLLSVVVLLAAVAAGATARPPDRCLACHPPHYRQQGSCSDCHRGNPAAARKSIAHAGLLAGRYAAFTLPGSPVVKEGERLLEQFACRRCHVSGGRGNRLAASLDTVAAERSPAEIVAAIGTPAEGMPRFAIGDAQMTAVVNGLYCGGTRGKRGKERPRVVFFEKRGAADDLFTRKCGSCHRLLSERLGALGRSDAGPNLSGLLTPHYPRNAGPGVPWTEQRLKDWLYNPRTVRPWSLMQPVRLSDGELHELMRILTVTHRKDPASFR